LFIGPTPDKGKYPAEIGFRSSEGTGFRDPINEFVNHERTIVFSHARVQNSFVNICRVYAPRLDMLQEPRWNAVVDRNRNYRHASKNCDPRFLQAIGGGVVSRTKYRDKQIGPR
jgi:hypothetical protein